MIKDKIGLEFIKSDTITFFKLGPGMVQKKNCLITLEKTFLLLMFGSIVLLFITSPWMVLFYF